IRQSLSVRRPRRTRSPLQTGFLDRPYKPFGVGVQFGYWNSLRKGLLAGDQLMYDLRSMDKAYHDQNAREYELTKHISLAQLDGSALQSLKTNRDCWIALPEELFDMDYPGHYMRRVKTVSLTLPCVAGPYTSVACTLTMTRNSMRVTNGTGKKY